MPVVVLLAIAATWGMLAGLVAARFPYAAPGAATSAPVAREVARASGGGRLRRWLHARRDPQVLTGLLLTAAAAVVLAGAATLAVLAALVRGNATLRRLDASAAEWGNAHATPWTDRVLDIVTRIGDTPFVAVAGVLVVAAAWRRGRARAAVPFLLVTVVGVKLLTTGVKDLVDRARPTLKPVAETLGPSFPSGHSSTAAAFLAAAALVLGIRRGRRARVALAGAAAGLATAVACSRVLLDVHWVSDVVAGLALGWAWFALCAIAFGGRVLRFGDPLARAEATAPPPRGMESGGSGHGAGP